MGIPEFSAISKPKEGFISAAIIWKYFQVRYNLQKLFKTWKLSNVKIVFT